MVLGEDLPEVHYLDTLPDSIKVDKNLLPGLRERMPGLYRDILDGIDITVTSYTAGSKLAPLTSDQPQ